MKTIYIIQSGSNPTLFTYHLDHPRASHGHVQPLHQEKYQKLQPCEYHDEKGVSPCNNKIQKQS